MKNSELLIYSFYKFKNIDNKKLLKLFFDDYFKDKIIRGTILLADEGINASISGTSEDLSKSVKIIKKKLKIRKLDIKINKNDFLPFNRMKVRLKKEIVSLGQEKLKIDNSNKRVSAYDWDKLIIQKDVKIIDVRNDYEISIGRFKRAINPKTKSFRDFPNKLRSINIKKNDKIAMYCTGGIRCEKAAAFMTKRGFKNIVQLDGGVLKYLDYKYKNKEKTSWNGQCFVFDSRVTINKKLNRGTYTQCHGCRRPLTKKDTISKNYMHGVFCSYCFKERSDDQKSRSLMRQKLIKKIESSSIDHPLRRINKKTLIKNR